MSELDQVPNTRKTNPWKSKTPVEAFSSDDVGCYRDGKNRFLFVPTQDEVPNDVSRALDYAYRRGRVMMINDECQGFDVGLEVGINQTVDWPFVHLTTYNRKNNFGRNKDKK